MKTIYSIIMVLITLCTSVVAQENSEQDMDMDQFLDMSLEELMNLKVSIATTGDLNIRETPGIVTVITEQDIENSGARDIADILRLVPGFDIAVDVLNIQSLGFRGHWGGEAKILVMVDGIPWNETAFGIPLVIDAFLPEQISQIQVIRGPGSAIYGGSAGLAVINIITKNGKDLQGGGYVTGNYGISEGSTLRQNLQVGFGNENSDGLRYSVNGSIQRSGSSNKTIDGILGQQQFDYEELSETDLYNVNVNIGKGHYGVRYIYNQHQQNLIGLGATTTSTYHFVEGKYDWKLSDKMTLSPKLIWQSQSPYVIEGFPPLEYNRINTRSTAQLTLNYDPFKNLNIVMGGEFIDEQSRLLGSDQVFQNNRNKMYLDNKALFIQSIWKNKIANLTAGVRYSDNSGSGDAWVPRLGLTKVINRFHAKLLYSRAFKAPTTANIDWTIQGVTPEFFNSTELELGYQINSQLGLTANFFEVKNEDAITFAVGEFGNTSTYDYANSGDATTRGVEVQVFFRNDRTSINGSYSFYKNHETDVLSHLVTTDEDLLLGFPAHKLTISGGYKVSDHINVSTAFMYQSEKYSEILDPTFTLNTFKADPVYKIDTFVNYEDLIVDGLAVGIGVYNILDSDLWNLTPYLGFDQQYMPNPGREFLVRVNYNLSR